MDNTRQVTLTLRLPEDLADQAEELHMAEPEFLERVVQFGLLRREVYRGIRERKVAIKGPVTTPVGTGFRSVNVAMRKTLNLYACVRPCKTYPGVRTRYDAVDIVIVRENTEDLYVGVEFEKGSDWAAKLSDLTEASGQGRLREDAGVSLKPISEMGSRRIVKYAFE